MNQRRTRFDIGALCALMGVLAVSAHAAVLDFEDFDLGGAVYLNVAEFLVFPDVQGSGVTVTITAGADNRIYDLFLFGGSPLETGRALIDWPWPAGANTVGTLYQFDHDCSVVSLDVGDFMGDSDTPLTLVAYDVNGVQLGSVTADWPSSMGPPFTTLTVEATGIRRVRFTSGGTYAGSTFQDDLTFIPAGVSVEPQTWGGVKALFR